jgi:hypothetical protein
MSFDSSVCVDIIVYNIMYKETVWKPSNCWTLRIHISSDATRTRAFDTLGRTSHIPHDAEWAQGLGLFGTAYSFIVYTRSAWTLGSGLPD